VAIGFLTLFKTMTLFALKGKMLGLFGRWRSSFSSTARAKE
jgi:hypothetical protein